MELQEYEGPLFKKFGWVPGPSQFERYKAVSKNKGKYFRIKNQGPRRKRKKRVNRLQVAQHWIQSYSGKNFIRGYRNWFGVDSQCAQILTDIEQRIMARRKKLEQEKQALENSNDWMKAFIASMVMESFPVA